MKFTGIFQDSNPYNEKSIIGYISFVIMSIIAIIDTIMGILGKPFVIHDYIYNSFVFITLGAFGIDQAGKMFGKKPQIFNQNNDESSLDTDENINKKTNQNDDGEPPETY